MEGRGGWGVENLRIENWVGNTYKLYVHCKRLIRKNTSNFTRKAMSAFTSTLPDDLLRSLSEKASKLAMPKNKLIEKALRLYLEHLDKAEYIKSYQQAAADKDLLLLAEEGMENYLKQLQE